MHYTILLLMKINILISITSQQEILPSKIIKIGKTQQQIPIINLLFLSNEFVSIDLILDTGSSQLVLFDNQCYHCKNTFSVCPHIKNINQNNSVFYMTDKMKGDYSYFTLSERLRLRFFCVIQKQLVNNQINQNGVLGLRIGINMKQGKVIQGNGMKIWRKIILKMYEQKLKEYLKNDFLEERQNATLKYSFFYTPYHTNLIVGNIPFNISDELIAKFQSSLPIKCTHFILNSQLLPQTVLFTSDYQLQVHFDSGSNVIVLPFDLFESLVQQLNFNFKFSCSKNQQNLLKCSKRNLRNLIENRISIQIKLNQKYQILRNETKIKINLQKLIQKQTRKNDEMIYLKIVGMNKTQEKQQMKNKSEIIILGVPFFKQYLIQYEIPLFTQENSFSNTTQSNKLTFNNQNNSNRYLLNLYSPKHSFNNQSISTYDHLIKKYDKNIKIFTLLYLIFILVTSYGVIETYWRIDGWMRRKR